MKARREELRKRRGRTDFDALRRRSDEETVKQAMSDPVAPPMTDEQLRWSWRPAYLKNVRAELRLSQSEFAETFGFSLSAVRDWEQGRHIPERSARTLIRMIRDEPDQVARYAKMTSG